MKVKKAWKVVRSATSTTSASEDPSEVVDTSKEALSEEEANDVAYSVKLQGFDKVPCTAIMRYLDNPRKMWAVLHEHYATDSTFRRREFTPPWLG